MPNESLNFDPEFYSQAALAEVDAACDEFENLWLSNAQPRIEDLVKTVSSSYQPIATAQLIRIEVELMQQAGCTLDLQPYRSRFPDFCAVIDEADAQAAESLRVSGDSTAATRVNRSGGPEAESLPQQLGRYRIQRELGRGGMGMVYLARDTTLDRPVALKVPKFRESDSAGFIERFYREARAMAAIKHRNLCAVHDVAQIDGIHCLAMEFIDGPTLNQRLKRKPKLTQTDAARLVSRLGRAVQVAHDAGVVHRDLKPGNVMIDEHAEPMIMDFGLARHDDRDDARLTADGDIIGTPAYMAPEQIGDHPELIGRLSDIYSLGVILYETIAGQTPFVGSAMSVLGQLHNDTVKPLADVHPEVDRQLSDICAAALARDPRKRIESAATLADQLDDWLDTQSASSTVSTALPTEVEATTEEIPQTEEIRTNSGREATLTARMNKKSPRWKKPLACLMLVTVVAFSVFVFRTPTQVVTVTVPDGADVDVTITQNGNVVEVIGPDDEWTTKLVEGQYQISLRPRQAGGNTAFAVVGGNTLRITPATGKPVTIVVEAVKNTDVQRVATNATGSKIIPTAGGRGPFELSAEVFDTTDVWDSELVDIDNDGDLDVILASAGETGGAVFVNDGTAAFKMTQHLPRAARVIIGDVDGDGDIDVWLSPRLDPCRVLLNDGSGRFEDSGQQLGEGVKFDAMLADLDGDGDLDCFLSKSHQKQGAPNEIFLNDGSGHFENAGFTIGKASSRHSVAFDADGDGDLDVCSANVTRSGRSILWLNDGAAQLKEGQQLNDGCRSVAHGDIDGDGDQDLVLGNALAENQVYINDGQGHFTAGAKFDALECEYLALADMDNDGDLDVIAANSANLSKGYRTKDMPTSIWLNDGAGFFEAEWEFAPRHNVHVSVGDVDGDGDRDVIAVGRDGRVQLIINTSNDSAEKTQSSPHNLPAIGPREDTNASADAFVKFVAGQQMSAVGKTHLAIIDIDGDGDLDMVIGRSNQMTVHGPGGQIHQLPADTSSVLWLNDGGGKFVESADHFPPLGRVAVGDVNGDGRSDIATTFYRNKTFLCVLGNADQRYEESRMVPDLVAARHLLLADLDGDLDLDAFVSAGHLRNDRPVSDRHNLVLLNDGSGQFSNSEQRFGRNNTMDAVALDADGDGDLDVCCANADGSGDCLWLNDGAAKFTEGFEFGNHSRALAAGDVDADGDVDLVFGNPDAENTVWFNDGNGQFAVGKSDFGGGSCVDIDLVDLDGDADLDAIVANRRSRSLKHGATGAANSVWWNDGHGQFLKPTPLPLWGPTSELLHADLNGDGRPDLIDCTQHHGTCVIMMNQAVAGP